VRIVVDIGHPAQVHFFKNFIRIMESRGHQVFITASEKDVTRALLDAYDFRFINLGHPGSSLLRKIVNVPINDLRMYQMVRKLDPDIFVGMASVRAAHVAWLMRKPSVIFDDDEYTYPFYRWFASSICVFSGFKLEGKKVKKIPAYKELAYLHPNWFLPPGNSLTEDPITLLRFVSWGAFHDVGQCGFALDFKRKLVSELEKHSQVFISSEALMPADLEKYRIAIRPEEMHRFLSNIKLLVSDSQTMTTEAAVLGIPAIRCNSFVGINDMGNFVELEKKYGLIFNYRDPDTALSKAVELLKEQNTYDTWQKKRAILLQDKIDITSYMVEYIENYPALYRNLKGGFSNNE